MMKWRKISTDGTMLCYSRRTISGLLRFIARYQQALRHYHSRRVHARCFEEGDLVLRRVQSAKGTNKLSLKWEGPYRVVPVTKPGVVRLETGDGTELQNSWNIEHLRKYYP